MHIKCYILAILAMLKLKVGHGVLLDIVGVVPVVQGHVDLALEEIVHLVSNAASLIDSPNN